MWVASRLHSVIYLQSGILALQGTDLLMNIESCQTWRIKSNLTQVKLSTRIPEEPIKKVNIMKTLTYQDLLADCLNPVDVNNEPIMDSEGKQISFQNLDELKSYVVNLSASICQSRKSKLSKVKECQEAIKSEATSLRQNIQALIDGIPSFVGGLANTISEEEKDVIVKDCKDVLSALEEYETNISILSERFEHGKIRISSIGQARQGKSTFTQLYTGLGEDKIPTHVGNVDTTGTVCVLHHTETESESYSIEYYKEQDVLDTLNYYIEEIREKKGKHWNLCGISEFTSIDQLKPHIGKFDVDDIDKGCKPSETVGEKILSGLKPYFQKPEGKTKWYDCLTGTKKKVTSWDEVKKHMLMFDPSLMYLATKRIDLYCQFEKNGQLFQSFEVVDTKGGGTKAGLAVNKEILSSIQYSDAIFSVCLLENSTNYGIYEDLLAPKFKNDPIFMQKHFVILNPRDGSEMTSGVDTMERYHLCNIAYGNSLKNEDAQDFSELVIANMLLRIATLVDNFDRDRIEKCNQAQTTINKKIEDLSKRVGSIKTFNFEEKDAITKKIVSLVKEAREYVENLKQKESSQSQKKGYKDYYSERATLYEMITDNRAVIDIDKIEKASNKPSINKNLEDKEFAEEEIREAIKKIYCELKPSVEVNEEHVGQYIEETLVLLNDRIVRSVNRLTRQREIGNADRQEIFNKLWEIFRLNVIFEEEQWKDSLVTSCDFFEALNEVNKPMVEPPITNKDLAHPYDVLKYYFKGYPNNSTTKDDPSYKIREKYEPGIRDEEYLNVARLQYVLAKELSRCEIYKKITEKYNLSFDVIPTLCAEIRNLLTGDKLIASKCYDFYVVHNEILSEKDRDRINLSKKWRELANANMSIKKLNVSIIKLS